MPPADPSASGRLGSEAYVLTIRQAPLKGKVVGNREKASDRKPVDPPPIVQLRIRDPNDPSHNYLQSPYYFVCCNLWDPVEDKQASATNSDSQAAPLAGNVASCLHRLKDTDNTDGGFFVFGDVSIRLEGRFRLRFALFELMQGTVICHTTVISDPFTVYSAKSFPGMNESTFLSRSFGDQGVRLRIRKEARAQKRPSSRGHGGGEQPPQQGYPQQQRPSASSASGSVAYSQGAGYTPNSGRPGDRAVYARPPGQEAWAYTAAQSSVNAYATHPPAAAGYGQDAASTPQQPGLAYRNPATEGAMVQPGYMPRQHMSEYSTPQHQVAYDQQRGYGHQESPSAHYGDGRLSQPMSMNRHGHPGEGMAFGEISYADQQAMMAGGRNAPYPYQAMDQRSRASYGSAGTSGSNTLPPLGSSTTVSSQAALAGNPAYAMTASPGDARYAAHPQAQGNVRDYGGYPPGMHIKEEYS